MPESVVDGLFRLMQEESEKAKAIYIAKRILDRDWGDPDDDYGVLARQLLRALERLGEYRGW